MGYLRSSCGEHAVSMRHLQSMGITAVRSTAVIIDLDKVRG